MSITAETAKAHANDPAVLCCRTEAGITIEPANLEDPAIFDELVDTGLLNLDGCLKIGQVLGAKLTKTSDSLCPLTVDNVDGIVEIADRPAGRGKAPAFPYSFLKELDKITNQKIDQITQQNNEAIQRLNDSNNKIVYNLSLAKSKSVPEYGQFAGGGFIIGLVIGVFICFAKSDAIEAKTNFFNSIGSGLVLWLMFGAVGAVMSLILCGLIKSVQNSSDRNVNNKIAIAKSDVAQQIADETKRCEEAIQKIRNDANYQYQNYLSEFNAEAQKMSVRFAESPLAVEVIDWMTNGFAKTIDAADRRSHIQEINIPFVFRIYRNKIECNLGTFDFEIKRCAELETPLEQTALARAIASAIQLNITMKYPRDASGTNVVTNIAYDYKNDNVIATIVYTAPNGNYKAIRDWAVN